MRGIDGQDPTRFLHQPRLVGPSGSENFAYRDEHMRKGVLLHAPA